MEFPKHMSMTIEHNEHKNYYMTIWDFLVERLGATWHVQLYPMTPISFCSAYGATLDKCIEMIKEDLKKE